MITNFEGITSPLTEDEMKIIPYLVDGLKRRSSTSDQSILNLVRTK